MVSAARKGVITGIVVSGVGLAAVYISPLTQYLLLHNHHFEDLCLARRRRARFGPLPGAVFAKPARTAGGRGVGRARRPAVRRRELDWQEMLRTGQFYQFWLLMVLSASAGMMIITQVAVIAKEQANWSWGFVPIATLAIFNTVGRLLSGLLSDKIGRTRTMSWRFCCRRGTCWLSAITPARRW